LYDTYKCTSCGITGTRHIVGEIIHDEQYSAKIYYKCDDAEKQLARNAVRKPRRPPSKEQRIDARKKKEMRRKNKEQEKRYKEMTG